ncbi:uncharacterized protein LOC143239449 [Tachypleus tridentatus]|uniref:uncharacterized protein LOC143239449 n=1 Tax=Tachypleus tridentatus TaxID=6853 RepID=UPI003FD52FBF
MMVVDHRFLLTVLAMTVTLLTCTVYGAVFQNEYQTIPKDNIHYKEGLNTQSSDSHIGHNSQKNGHHSHGEEIGHALKAKRLVLDQLIRSLAQKARTRNGRSKFFKNQYSEEDVRTSKDVPQERKLAGRKSDGPPKEGKTFEAEVRGGSYIASKRGDRPSLSIVSPLDVLSQRLMLEMARRKMKQSRHQITANAEFLKILGKRNLLIHKRI